MLAQRNESSTDREKLPVSTSPAQDQGHSSKTGNGGGSKPASGKQLSWIEAMCLRQAVAPENVAREICAKPLEKLTGADANKIIPDSSAKSAIEHWVEIVKKRGGEESFTPFISL